VIKVASFVVALLLYSWLISGYKCTLVILKLTVLAICITFANTVLSFTLNKKPINLIYYS